MYCCSATRIDPKEERLTEDREMAESAETESPKPKASAHFNIAENLEYEYEAETLNQGNGSPADRRRPSSHAMRSSMRSSFLTTNFDISYHPGTLS